MRVWAIACAWVVLITGCRNAAEQAQAVVLVTLDTTRADRLGCYGNRSIQTPVLDGLAREGVIFDHASAVAPITLPSHASMMTGRYPATHGVRNNGMYALPGSERTLAEVFQAHGYSTGAFIGSYPVSSTFGLSQGFETFDENFQRGAGSVQYTERSASEVNAAALPWISRQKGKKFFLWVHYFDPHTPYQPPPPFAERYAANPYDGEIAFVDMQLGELLARLAEVAEPQRTIVAVLGDHGESHGEHGESHHGIFIYEATIRSPFILRARGRLPAGRRLDGPVSLVDVFPTLLHLAGLRGEIGPSVQGVNLPVTRPGPAAMAQPDERPIVIESLLSRLEYGWGELRGIRHGRWKYISAPRPELYDLAADPQEKLNLLAAGSPTATATAAGGTALDAASAAATLKARLDDFLARSSASDPEVSARRRMDQDTIAKLRTLGYLQGPAPAPVGFQGADPKDMVGLASEIEEVGTLLQQGRFEEVIAAGRKYLDRDPGNSRVQYGFAAALLYARKYDELERFLGSLKDDLPHFWVPRLRAVAREGRGDAEGAIALYRLALEKDPDYVANAIRIATIYRQQGKLQDSLEQARRILDRFPNDLPALRLAADVERQLGKIEAAEDLWERALEVAPDDILSLSSLGRLRFDARRFDEARPLFERVSLRAPENPEALRYLGGIALAQRRYPQALELLRRAQSLAPDDEVASLIGLALMGTGDLAGAERQLLALVEQRPNSPDGHRSLAMVHLRQGRREAAVGSLLRTLSLNPNDRAAQRLLKEAGAGP